MKNPMSWVTWVVIIILLGTLVMQLISGLVGFREVPMNQIMSVLQSGEKLKEVALLFQDETASLTAGS